MSVPDDELVEELAVQVLDALARLELPLSAARTREVGAWLALDAVHAWAEALPEPPWQDVLWLAANVHARAMRRWREVQP